MPQPRTISEQRPAPYSAVAEECGLVERYLPTARLTASLIIPASFPAITKYHRSLIEHDVSQ